MTNTSAPETTPDAPEAKDPAASVPSIDEPGMINFASRTDASVVPDVLTEQIPLVNPVRERVAILNLSLPLTVLALRRHMGRPLHLGADELNDAVVVFDVDFSGFQYIAANAGHADVRFTVTISNLTAFDGKSTTVTYDVVAFGPNGRRLFARHGS